MLSSMKRILVRAYVDISQLELEDLKETVAEVPIESEKEESDEEIEE